MNKESEIIELASQSLRESTGLKINWQLYGKAENKVYGIIFQDRVMQFIVEYKQSLTVHQVDQVVKKQDIRYPLLVVAEQIAAAARAQLRMKGIAYLEANGNIFIHNSQGIIFLDGNKPIKLVKPLSNRAFTRTGLKAVFHLLNNPAAITKTYRQLAGETGIALGNIKYIIDGLADAGYLHSPSKRKLAIKNKIQLLDRWIAGYRETLKGSLLQGAFRIKVPEKRNYWQELNLKDLNMEWGGEAAGELMGNTLQARVLTLYTQEFTDQQINTLGLIPDRKGDVLVYEKFWNGHDDKLHTVPPLIVYADLLMTEDHQCIATANLIYEKLIKNQIESN